MRIALYVALVVGTVAAFAVGIQYNSTAGTDALDKEAVKAIVRETIQEEPQMIIDALTAWQEQEKARELQERQAKVGEVMKGLSDVAHVPVVGNAQGDVTVVEFFDYNCPYCKTSFMAIDALIKSDDKVKVLLMEMPIFGAESDKISSIALAVHQLDAGKYYDFHAALMNSQGRMSATKAMAIAEEMGLDKDAIEAKAKDDSVKQAILEVREIAESLNISGTPAFIVGEAFFGGAMNESRLKAVVEEQRNAASAEAAE